MQWSDGEDFEVKKPVWLGDWATAIFGISAIFSTGTRYYSSCDTIPGVVENANLHRSSRIAVLVTGQL